MEGVRVRPADVRLSDPASIVRFIFDEYAAKILAATSSRAMSPLELSWKLRIPIAESYRRCRQLEDFGLLTAEGTGPPVRNGKAATLWRSNVLGVHVAMEHRRMTARVELRTGVSIEGEIV